jgi:NAD(P)-dependent dehydrogenase (short-subunit alcohol dehydrogenase family)
MSPTTPRTVLVTGAARRLGSEIALALAASGWRVAVHYRGSAEDAMKTVAACATSTPGAAAFQADLADEFAVRALLPQVVTQLGAVDAVVNSASVFEHDTAASFGFAALDRHLHTNTGAAVLLAQALHDHLAVRDASGAVVNLLDQKLWNPNPDFFSYTLSKAALEAATTLLAQAFAPPARGGRGARPDADQPHAERRQVRGAAQAVAAGPLVHAGRRGRHREVCAGELIHHRHHPAGGRRPAPDEIRPRFFADVRPPPC